MRQLLLISLLCLPIAAWAENYLVTGNWTDPTPNHEAYSPVYDVEWRINGGEIQRIDNLPEPNFGFDLVASPGDLIEIRVRGENTQGPVAGDWTIWYQATAGVIPIRPLEQTGVIITITPQ